MIETIVYDDVSTSIEGTDLVVTYSKEGSSRVDRVRADGSVVEACLVPPWSRVVAMNGYLAEDFRRWVVRIDPNPDAELVTATVSIEEPK